MDESTSLRLHESGDSGTMVNVLANPNFGTVISESGMLTPGAGMPRVPPHSLDNDPVRFGGEAFIS